MHGSSREPIRSDVVGGGDFYCLYCLLQSHRAGALESLLLMEYIWPKHPMVVVGVPRKERTEKQTNEPRDDIFSQRDVLLGCHCCRRCVLVAHENCRCPKIFLLRLPKLHVQWPSTFSITQTVYLAVKKVVVVPGLEVPPRGDFHPASIPRGRTVLISPMGIAGMESAISTKGGGDSPEYLG